MIQIHEDRLHEIVCSLRDATISAGGIDYSYDEMLAMSSLVETITNTAYSTTMDNLIEGYYFWCIRSNRVHDGMEP